MIFKKKKQKKMNMRAFGWLIALCVVFGLIGTLTPAENMDPSSQSSVSQSQAGEVSGEDSSSTSLPLEEQPDKSEETNQVPDQSDSGQQSGGEEPVLPANSTFSVHYIDVGQADAALVECDGHYMLVDGGNKGDSNVIYSVLKQAGAANLDLVVGTHAHEDHIGGLPGAFNYATAAMTLCPVTDYDSDAFEDFARYAQQKGGGIIVPRAGDEYALGSAKVKILGVNGGSDTNDTSIVLKVQYGQTAFLFTGDAEREAEQAVLNSGADLSATVLKVGHHGSDTSTTYPFLREIMPEYAVVSVGKGNSYDHPTDAVLSRLRDADVKVYRTDLHGDVKVVSDGANVTISTDKTASEKEVMTAGGTVQTVPASKPEPTPAPKPTPEPEPEPVGTDYILNINSMKFHYPSCGSAARMKESNKRYFTGTRQELISRGYSPCGNCDP